MTTTPEQDLYYSLKCNKWGQNIRLEQERIRWDKAWKAIQMSLERKQ
ncbi:Wadjet anti-phage system protein JetD domain-containing protein [Nitrosomonas sp. Nm166]